MIQSDLRNSSELSNYHSHDEWQWTSVNYIALNVFVPVRRCSAMEPSLQKNMTSFKRCQHDPQNTCDCLDVSFIISFIISFIVSFINHINPSILSFPCHRHHPAAIRSSLNSSSVRLPLPSSSSTCHASSQEFYKTLHDSHVHSFGLAYRQVM